MKSFEVGGKLRQGVWGKGREGRRGKRTEGDGGGGGGKQPYPLEREKYLLIKSLKREMGRSRRITLVSALQLVGAGVCKLETLYFTCWGGVGLVSGVGWGGICI